MFLPLTTVKTMSVTLGGCGVVKVTSIVTGVTDPGEEVTPVVEKMSLGTTSAGKPEVVTVMTLGVVSSIASVQGVEGVVTGVVVGVTPSIQATISTLTL